MKFYNFLELATYLALLPIVYKVVIAIDITKIFHKNRTAEIRMFYFILIIIITKIFGDFLITIMDYIRILLGITS